MTADGAPTLGFSVPAAARSIATATGVPEKQVVGTIELLLEGHTVPFIARYRKERTAGADDEEIGRVQDALESHRTLLERKNTVLATVHGLGALTPELERRIVACGTRAELEDLYLPYKPKRRTRAEIARERGLEPLADLLASQRDLRGPREKFVVPFVAPARGVADGAAALAGAADILAERWAENAEVRAWLRAEVRRGHVRSRKKRGYDGADRRFETWYDFREPLVRAASHRLLALRRGREEGALSIGIDVDTERLGKTFEGRIIQNPRFLFRAELAAAVQDSLDRLLLPSLENEVLRECFAAAERDAIEVFGRNLRELLLAPPVGPRTVLGIDPGFRTGCKAVVVDPTGRVLEYATIFPTPPRSDVAGAGRIVADLVRRHAVELIAIGNGTASRETEAFARETLASVGSPIDVVLVSEAGASVYSASPLARHELPELDVSVRGAVSIARRLQDPLAELVKIEPRSIGVGQYQHDVDQAELGRALDRVVETAVNRVGVDVNTASAPLLAHVAGIGPRLAEAIVARRDEHGAFRSRRDLLGVPRLGAKTFEQAAGFLRIRDGDEPLDASAVHPESYSVVAAMARSVETDTRGLLQDRQRVAAIDLGRFVDERIGLPTLEDIARELEKPGRDPRREFRAARFREDVASIADLEPGMELEGVVTNVTNFGAFVDVGVHQDGLVHVSELADHFIADPAEAVRVGEIVTVRVLAVDAERSRISLTRRRQG